MLTTNLNLKVKKMPGFVDFRKAHDGDAGFDLYATEDVFLFPGRRISVKVGIATSFSPEYVMFIKSRSGNAKKFGIVKAGGVIDSGYRGEWEVILVNTQPIRYIEDEMGHIVERSVSPVRFKKGDKIAQVVPIKISNLDNEDVEFVEELEESERNEAGFGSTDVKKIEGTTDETVRSLLRRTIKTPEDFLNSQVRTNDAKLPTIATSKEVCCSDSLLKSGSGYFLYEI